MRGHKGAAIDFGDGINSLRGVPPNYAYYMVYYIGTAIPTHDNVETILQWRDMEMLRIEDKYNFVTIALSRRLYKLRQLTKLAVLVLSIRAESSDRINVAVFIENIPNLERIEFETSEWSDEERDSFYRRNSPPMNWIGEIYGTTVSYQIAFSCRNTMNKEHLREWRVL